MSRPLGAPTPGDEVLICHKCGEHEFISEGVDVDRCFYCNECASKEES